MKLSGILVCVEASMEQEKYFMRACRLVCIDAFQTRLLKIVLFSIYFFLTFCFILQTGLFLYKFDLNYFIRFGPTYFISLFVLCSALGLPFFKDITLLAIEEIDSWKIDTTQVDVVNRGDLKRATIYVVLSLFCGLITSVTFVLPSRYDRDIIYILDVAELIFPASWNVAEAIYCGIYRLGLIPTTIIAVISPCHYVLYALLRFKFQANALLFHIKQIDQIEEIDTKILQDVIKERLVFCLQHHINLCRSLRKNLRMGQDTLFPLRVVGVLMLASVVILTFTLERTVFEDWSLRIVTLTFLTFMIIVGLVGTGQAFEDMSINIFDALLTVQWNEMNSGNKKLYLIFLTNALKPFKIKYSENISLNYKMGIELVKGYFSAISIVSSLQHSRS